MCLRRAGSRYCSNRETTPSSRVAALRTTQEGRTSRRKLARPAHVTAVQLFAAAAARPYAGPGLKPLVLCKLSRVTYAGAWRPLAAERMIRWADRTHRITDDERMDGQSR